MGTRQSQLDAAINQFPPISNYIPQQQSLRATPPLNPNQFRGAGVAAGTAVGSALDRLTGTMAPYYIDIMYLLMIVEYIGLMYMSTIFRQAQPVENDDTQFCLPNFTETDKKFFKGIAITTSVIGFILPLILMGIIYFRNKRKVNLQSVQQLVQKAGKRSGVALLILSIILILTLIGMFIAYFVLINNVSIDENPLGGYCLNVARASDFTYLKGMNWLSWVSAAFTNLLLMYL